MKLSLVMMLAMSVTLAGCGKSKKREAVGRAKPQQMKPVDANAENTKAGQGQNGNADEQKSTHNIPALPPPNGAPAAPVNAPAPSETRTQPNAPVKATPAETTVQEISQESVQATGQVSVKTPAAPPVANQESDDPMETILKDRAEKEKQAHEAMKKQQAEREAEEKKTGKKADAASNKTAKKVGEESGEKQTDGSTHKTAEKTNKQPPGSSEVQVLSAVEMVSLQTILSSQLGKNAEVIWPTRFTQDRKPELFSLDISGTHEKLNYKIAYDGKVFAELKDFNVAIIGLTRVQIQDRLVHAICSGSNCETLFLAIGSLNEKRQIMENVAAKFKWSKDKYILALDAPNEEEIKEAMKNFGKNEMELPIQLRILNKMSDALEKANREIMTAIRSRVLNENAMYSSIFLHGAISMTPDLKRTEQGFDFKLDIPFIESVKREDIHISGAIKNASSKLEGKNGLIVRIGPAILNHLYVMILEKPDYTSLTKQKAKAMIAQVCALIDENNKTFVSCMVIPASAVLETNALEGYIGGPAVVSVKEDGTPEVLEKIEPKKK